MDQSPKDRSRWHINIPARIMIVVVLSAGLWVCLARVMQYRDLKAQKASLEEQIISRENTIAELQNLLQDEMSEDYVVRIARDKLHLYFPDDVIFYNDFNH